MKRLVVNLITLIFGVLLSLLLVEIVVRVFFPLALETAKWNDRPLFYFRQEDSETLQDFKYSPIKPEHTFRIAVIGDSYSFAPYMQFTDTFVKKLEQMLNLNSNGERAQVINYGVPGLSTMHEVAAADRALAEDADLLILQITLNDAELKPYQPRGIDPDLVDRFGNFKLDDESPTIYRYWHTLAFIKSRLHNNKSYREYKEYFPKLFNNSKGWREYTNAVGKIKNACKKNDKRLVAVIFPLFGLPVDDKYPFLELHQKIGKHLEEEGIAYLDLLEYYRGIPLERLQVIPGADRHPNEIAHRIAAERIYIWLEEREFIPKELEIKYRYSERLGITGNGLIVNK